MPNNHMLGTPFPKLGDSRQTDDCPPHFPFNTSHKRYGPCIITPQQIRQSRFIMP